MGPTLSGALLRGVHYQYCIKYSLIINTTHVETRSATIEIERTIESLARGLNTMAKIASPEVAKTDRDTSTTFVYFFSGLMIKLGG